MSLDRKLLTASLYILMLSLLTACQSDTDHGADASQADVSSTVWSVSASSKNKHFDGVLTCQQLPFVGEFQQCYLQLSQLGDAVDSALLAIDGGMKAHGHGLPTKPKLNAVGNQIGQYQIDGLKFSMMGEWTLGFLIEANGVNDQLIFDFTI